jgi:acetyl/propionyl-CoA carboxylase alpha subunit
MSNIIAAAEITNADALHLGYGFLSENVLNFQNLSRTSNKILLVFRQNYR